MTAEELVHSEISQGRFQQYDLPVKLQEAVTHYCATLVALVAALQSTGQEPAVIRAMVTSLLRGYEADLIQVLEVPN